MNLLASDLNHILDHTRDLWEELRGERIFITGGTGFFGCWLLESFLWANQKLDLKASLSVLTRRPTTIKQNLPHLAHDPAITLYEGDVRTFVFPSGEFSHIIHGATESSTKLNTQNPLLMLDTIIEGTRHTLDFAKSCEAKKFLLTSSGAVYGKQPPEITHIPENYPGAPDPLDLKSAYGIGKRTAEYLCTLYANQNLEMKIARCFAFVGPYLPLDTHFAVGNFIRDALKGNTIFIKGDGTPHRSYLYAADLAIWLWTILFKGTPGRAYNVGSQESLSILEIAQTVTQVINPQASIDIKMPVNPNRSVERYVPATERALSELKLDEFIPLKEAISKMVIWLNIMEAQK